MAKTASFTCTACGAEAIRLLGIGTEKIQEAVQTLFPQAQVARMDRDETACEVTALRQVPPDLRSRYIPPTYSPYQICNALGHCSWHQRLVSPGRWERYDANEGLRAQGVSWDHAVQADASREYVRNTVPIFELESRARFPRA